jgi:cupin fold WbuC family metalloprotein
MTYRKANDEVYYADPAIAVAGQADIDRLKAIAAANPRRRARLCTHPGTDDALHEMIIVHSRGNYVPPHRHPGKSESFHVVEGELDVVVFAEDGAVKAHIRMGAPGSGKPFYYRLSEPWYHTVVPLSATVVFHEITNGPFRREDTVFAPWAPAETDDAVRCAAFVESLMNRLTGE